MKKNVHNNSISENVTYLLSNTSNYNHIIVNSSQEILDRLVIIIIEYLKFITKKIPFKNKQYYCFIIERGMDSLIHVFLILLYYTKNLEISLYHTQKSYYFYIEFIEQISDDNVVFLQLTSRDATIFMYKKTICELNTEHKKKIQEPSIFEKNMLSDISSYINMYKTLIQYALLHVNFNQSSLIQQINLYCDSVQHISNVLNRHIHKNKNNNTISLFINLLRDKNIDIILFFNLIDEFIIKIKNKKKSEYNQIKLNICDPEINIICVNNESHKIVDLILST